MNDRTNARRTSLLIAAASLGFAAAGLACGTGTDSSEASETNVDQSSALGSTTSIVAWHSKKCLAVSGASVDNGTPVVQTDCVPGAKEQAFEVRSLGGNAVQIVAAHSGKCLDVYRALTANGTALIQWECNTTYPNQRFETVAFADGTKQIKAPFSGKCVDVNQARQENGTPIITWDCVSSYPNQHFTFGAASTPAPTPTTTPTTTPAPTTPAPTTGVPTETSVGFKGNVAGLKTSLPPGASLDGNSVIVTQDGLVIDGYDFRDKNVILRANNVTIQNCIFSTGGYWDVLQDTNKSGLIVQDSTFDGLKRNDKLAAAIWSYTGASTIRRNKFVDMPSDVLNIRGGLVEWNYFAGSSYASGAHADAIYIPTTSSPVVVQNNYVDFRRRSDAPQGTNNCVRITTEAGGPINDVKLQNNVFRGGDGYTLSVQDTSTKVVVSNNKLEDTTAYGNGNYYWYPSYPADLVFTGNTDYLTGAAISLK